MQPFIAESVTVIRGNFQQRARVADAENHLKSLHIERAQIHEAVVAYAKYWGDDKATDHLAGKFRRLEWLDQEIEKTEHLLEIEMNSAGQREAAELKSAEMSRLREEFDRQRYDAQDAAFNEFVMAKAPHLLAPDPSTFEPDAPRRATLAEVVSISPNAQLDTPETRQPVKRGPKMYRVKDILAPRK